MELHVPPLLTVLPLHPSSGPVHLDPGRVDGYGYELIRLLPMLVVGVEGEAALSEVQVLDGLELMYEFV